MASEIDRILHPRPITNLRQRMPPVTCMIWRGGDRYDKITFDHRNQKQVYPFDTIDTIKRMLCAQFEDDPVFIPRFLFVGVPLQEPLSDQPPTLETTYHSIDYLWYPTGSTDPTKTYALLHPIKALTQGDPRFVTKQGGFAAPSYEYRGRTLIEDVFLKPNQGKLPVFHVFPFATLLQSYKRGDKLVSEERWNKGFAPYYPDVSQRGPYRATEEDQAFAEKIGSFIAYREHGVDQINDDLAEMELPVMRVDGIRQLLLTWPKPVHSWDGCATMFYEVPTTKQRPYLRLFPAEGSPITKLHVDGVLPIPTLDHPKLLEVWSKEISPSPGSDYCSIKYANHPSSGVYGTIRVFNDGTMNLLLQPPVGMRYLDPVYEFRNFNDVIEPIFEGLPQPFEDGKLKEISVLFSLSEDIKEKKFTRDRLLARLPYFSRFFTEITPLPNENPILSLRYKAVSQYASEDKIFTFITLLSTKKRLVKGEGFSEEDVSAIQDEFQLSHEEAREAIREWIKKEGVHTIVLPEEGEFIQNFNPGVDIHIYAQHSSYRFHVNRIESYETYQRIYTLLSLLFYKEDSYFKNDDSNEEEVDEESLSLEPNLSPNVAPNVAPNVVPNVAPIKKEPERMASMSTYMAKQAQTASTLATWMNDDPFNSDESPVAAEAAVSIVDPAVPVDPVIPASRSQPQVAPRALPAVAPRVAPKVAPKSSGPSIAISPAGWFIKKLQEMDKNLTGYETPKGSGLKPYSRLCQQGETSNQPAVLTRDQYEAMKAIYQDDPVFFIEYPLQGKEEPRKPAGIPDENVITVMRYGSSPNNIRYYFCPLYFCLYDEIMVLKTDFEGTRARDGKSKEPNTCPFCRKGLITDTIHMVPNETVFRRQYKSGTKPRLHPGFTLKTTHPDKKALPCCYTLKSNLRLEDDKFDHIRSAFQEEQYDEEEEEEEEVNYDELVEDRGINYNHLFQTLHSRYILEANKNPEPGVFAIAPPWFDLFFRQRSAETIAIRPAVKFEIRPHAIGFVRIGTVNTVYESLLGVLAPLLHQVSIKKVKEFILSKIKAKIFINANFGNLVLEFFDPTDQSSMPRTDQELMQWAQSELHVAINSNNVYQSMRVYNAYQRFCRFIRDPLHYKDQPHPIELRHLQSLLAEPGLFTPAGIQLIVMEDNGPDKPVLIKCPIFGVSKDRHLRNDMAFISRAIQPIGSSTNTYSRYELYVHTSNRPAKGGEIARHEAIIRWTYHSRNGWPEIVRQRVEEYMNQCQSRYRSLYTAQQGVQPMSIIPLSKVIQPGVIQPTGIVKDSYNHVIAVTYSYREESPQVVVLPVIDDGVFTISTGIVSTIYLDWKDVKCASAEDTIEFYQTALQAFLSLYPGYVAQHIVQNKDDRIVAIELQNRLYVPVDAASRVDLPSKRIDTFEWDINKDLAGIPSDLDLDNWPEVQERMQLEKGCGSDSELVRKSSYAELDETYQQFRYMVSNWLTSAAGDDLRGRIEQIIFNRNLPEYEKRKRVHILLSTILLRWFYTDDRWSREPTSFLRKDCRVIDREEGCTGTCAWSQITGQCLLHVPTETNLSDEEGERMVSTPDLFTKRVVDELVRFPARRKQLMSKGKISKLSTIIQPIRKGDQYIIPESSPTWTNLLRLDWTIQLSEQPQYYEEMSRETEEMKGEYEIPDELRRILGDDSPFHVQYLSTADPARPLLPLEAILGFSLDALKINSSETVLKRDDLIQYVLASKLPIGMINLSGKHREEPPIQFVTAKNEQVDVILILVFLQDEMGILVQEDDQHRVPIELLPNPIKRRWEDAGRIDFSRAPPPGPVVPRRPKPLVARAAQLDSSLVPAEPQVRKLPTVAPRVAPVSAAPVSAVPAASASASSVRRPLPVVAASAAPAASASASSVRRPLPMVAASASAAPASAAPIPRRKLPTVARGPVIPIQSLQPIPEFGRRQLPKVARVVRAAQNND